MPKDQTVDFKVQVHYCVQISDPNDFSNTSKIQINRGPFYLQITDVPKEKLDSQALIEQIEDSFLRQINDLPLNEKVVRWEIRRIDGVPISSFEIRLPMNYF